jgi:subtilisin-like proprotein convertase family protein
VTVANCTAVGACCVPSSASCQILSRPACEAAGGSYAGSGTLCSTLDSYGDPFVSGDTFPIAIPDYVGPTPGLASTSVTVAGSGVGTDLMKISVGLTHTFPGDLIGTLSNGTHSAALFSRQGGSSDVGGVYVFSTGGVITFAGGSPAGEYASYQSLTAFAGDPADGTWTLTVTDNAGIDVGTIDSFSIAFGQSHPTCSFCPPCAADYNQDGGVDGADISAFFPAWEAADNCADVNQDGGIDGGDIDAFFQVWQAGGC